MSCRADDILQRMNKLQRAVDLLKFKGASRSEFAVLYELYKNCAERHKTSAGRLAEYLDVSAPAVSRMLKNLRNKGLIASPSGKMKRGGEIALTEEGKSVVEENLEIYKGYITEILASYSDSEVDVLVSVWDKLIDFIDKKRKELRI